MSQLNKASPRQSHFMTCKPIGLVLPVIQPHFQRLSNEAEKSRCLMACKNKYNATIGYNSCESLAVQIITYGSHPINSDKFELIILK